MKQKKYHLQPPPPQHAPTYARPSLPVNQNPNLTPAEEYALALHDTVTTILRAVLKPVHNRFCFLQKKF